MRSVRWLKKEWIVSGSGASWCKDPEAGRDGAHARSWKKPLQGMKGQWLSGTQGQTVKPMARAGLCTLSALRDL